MQNPEHFLSVWLEHLAFSPMSCDLSLSDVSHLHTPLSYGLSVGSHMLYGPFKASSQSPNTPNSQEDTEASGKNQILLFCSLLNFCPWRLPFIPSLALYERLVVCILPDISRCFVKAAHLEYCLCCTDLGHNSFYFQTGSTVAAQKFFDRLKIKRLSEVNGTALVSTVVSSLNYLTLN